MPVTVSFEEVGERVEQVVDGKFRVSASFKCAWDQRLVLMAQLRGYSSTSSGTPIFTPGAAYPPIPGCRASDVTIKPFHTRDMGTEPFGSGALRVFEHAQLDVVFTPQDTFGSGSDSDPGQSFITERLEPMAEFVTIGSEQLYWDDSQEEPLADDRSEVGVLSRGMDYIYQRRMVTAIPATAQSLVGYVNNAALTAKRLRLDTGALMSFATETLLFAGTTLERETVFYEDGTVADDAWTMTLRFGHQPGGWNKVNRPGFDARQPVYTSSGSEYKPYPQANFASIRG